MLLEAFENSEFFCWIPSIYDSITFTPWPEEDVSADWINTNPNYSEDYPAPDPPVKNRENPWYNFACGGPYGLQGSWNRFGGIIGDATA